MREIVDSVERYAADKNVFLFKRNTRSIVAYKRKVKPPRRKIVKANTPPALEVCELDFHCVHGGRDNEAERSIETIQRGCPFNICIRLSKDGTYLYVKNTNLQHLNHNPLTDQHLQKGAPLSADVPKIQLYWRWTQVNEKLSKFMLASSVYKFKERFKVIGQLIEQWTAEDSVS